jgi:hypothetical protein
MKSKFVLIAACWFFAAGCHLEMHEEGGINYIRGQAGLGVGQDSDEWPAVPNLVEFDIPALRIHISSPAATEAARIALSGSAGVVAWVLGIVGSGLHAIGLAGD